jgi:uncharacterized zinc-type alcohol dehydrogenase-like protein
MFDLRFKNKSTYIYLTIYNYQNSPMETVTQSAAQTAGREKFTVKGYGASGELIGGKTLKPYAIERYKPGTDEVAIEVLYCGVCHSDIHQVENDWKNTVYPSIPGHEIVGRITDTGSGVTKFKTGDLVGVGCMIDSCLSCPSCQTGNEQYCESPTGFTATYNGYIKPDGSGFNTFGGYSTHVVVKEHFVLTIPESLDIRSAAPILCAGITTYSPLKEANIKAGDQVGIVGIGGLGHMAVMIAKAMGARVTAITTKEEKRSIAIELGADEVLVSENEEEMKAGAAKFKFLLCTIPDAFDVTPYISLLGVKGKLVTVGLIGEYKKPLNNMNLIFLGLSVGGSSIGGVPETQEVLQFCADHKIAPQVELINIEDINEAYEKIKNEEVRFRYVIDMASLKAIDE